MPLEKLYEMCDNEDTPELLKEIENFQGKIEELLHNQGKEIEIGESLTDIIAVAERQAFVKGFKLVVNLILS